MVPLCSRTTGSQAEASLNPTSYRLVGMRTIGAYEAKTHLSRLLEEVASGETITITRHGVPIAELRPAPAASRRRPAEVIAALRSARRGVTLGAVSLRTLIDEGRT